jgi:hypothetical protein
MCVLYLSEYCTLVHNHDQAPVSVSSYSFHDVHCQFSSTLLRFSIGFSAPENRLHMNWETIQQTTELEIYILVMKIKLLICPENKVQKEGPNKNQHFNYCEVAQINIM